MTDFLIKHFIKDYENIKDSNVRKHYGLLSGCVGIICNLILCLLKFIAGFLVSSIAIIADAFNNLSDGVSSIVTFAGFKMSHKPADKQHPFGHGRFEYISGLIISMTIIFMGIELIKSSIEKIFNPEEVFLNKFSIIILFFSIVLKLWMGFFNRKLSKIIKSAALKTVSVDSLADVIATSTVLIGSLITKLTGFSVDSYCGVVVAIFVIYTGVRTAKDTLDPLLGESADKEYVDEIKNKVLSYSGIYGVHGIAVHNYGPNYSLVSLHVEVMSTELISTLHKLVDKIEHDLKQEFHCDVIIHVDPIILESEVLDTIKEKVQLVLSEVDKEIKVSNFRIIEDAQTTNVVMDLLLPDILKNKEKDIIELIKKCVDSVNSENNLDTIVRI
ncbi:MAG: Ferrous-iron efflux pump FieF [Eubacteriales bacterium SKADARSKE-1]|nr:Ferrous-iron efflux pump FieF [Eubacteriales bacterium SKADARSKE-1]